MARSTGDLVSIKVVVNRLMQNPLMKNINFEFVIDHTIELLEILHHPSLYVKKRERLNVVRGKAKKPLGMSKIEAMVRTDLAEPIYMTHSEDIAQEFLGEGGYTSQRLDDTYTTNSTYINVNFDKGEVEVIYLALAVDEDCYPLILNDAVLIRCIESYLKYKWFDILNDMDMISDRKLNKAETDYCFNVAQADTSLKIPSADEMEALVNTVTQILPSSTEHSRRMEYLGAQEYRKIY